MVALADLAALGLTFGEGFTEALDSLALPERLRHLTLRYAAPGMVINDD